MANFGDINSNLTLGASQTVRRNAANSAWEAVTLTIDGLLPSQTGNSGKFLTTNGSAASWATIATGITIGSTSITSGTNNRVLYQASGVVSQGNLEFSGSELKVLNGTKHAEYSLDSSYNAIFGHAYSASDNVLQYQFKYYSTGGYNTRGLALMDVGNGFTTLLNQTASGSLYITDGAGTAGSLTLGTRTNPADGTTFIAQSGFWWINTGVFSVGTSSLQGNGQIESFSTSKPQYIAYYNSSNYFKTTVASNGATEFDAVGSGAKFTFKDNVVARLEKRVNSQTNVSTLTPNITDYDMERLTAQTNALTIATPSGTPTEGQELTIKIVAGSNNSISFTGNYLFSMAIALPTALVNGSTMLMEFHYDTALDSWLITNYQEY